LIGGEGKICGICEEFPSVTQNRFGSGFQFLVDGRGWAGEFVDGRSIGEEELTNSRGQIKKGSGVAKNEHQASTAVMAFIDTSDTIIGVAVAQIDARYVEPGQAAEVTFKFMPGQVFGGKVESVLQAVASGQVQTSGLAVTPRDVASAPFVVRIRLDDADIAQRLPAGSTGDAAVFTDHVKLAHIIRKVLLRQIAITNYINPF
jgi:hypothetical protein